MNGIQVANTYPYGLQPQLQADYSNARANTQKTDDIDSKIEKSALSAVPMFRRTMSLPDKMQSGDVFGALTLVGTAAILLPEDIRDTKNAIKQIGAKLKGEKYESAYRYDKYQHHFSFLKGSFVHEYLKNVTNERGKELVEKIYKADTSIYGTKIGRKIRDFLGIKNGKKYTSEVKNIFGQNMELSKIKAPSAFAELTGRAMKRMTVFGLGALALCELPKIIKTMFAGDSIAQQTENTVKQTVKSGINVASIATSIAYCGAYGAKKFGPAGSLIGMGFGALVGATASNKIQEII